MPLTHPVDEAIPGAAELSGSTRLGLWYLYCSSLGWWMTVARGFGIRVRASDADDDSLAVAEAAAESAAGFIAVPVAALLVTGAVVAWGAPRFGGFLASSSDAVFMFLARTGLLMGFDHMLVESGALLLVVLGIWLWTLVAVAVTYVPVWLLFRRQMHVAAPVIAVALAARHAREVAPGDGRLSERLGAYPRVAYALDMLLWEGRGSRDPRWRHRTRRWTVQR